MGDFVPTREAELVTWANNLTSKLSLSPSMFGISVEQAAELESSNDAWVSAYSLAQNEMTRSRGNIILKDQKKAALIAMARQLVGIIQKYPGTTDAMRADLGLTIPKPRTSVPRPVLAPEIDLISMNGHTMTLRLHNDTLGRRGKPENAKTASILTFVGPTASMDPNDWTFYQSTTRTVTTVVFDSSLPPGTTVWVSAFWTNEKAESGPGALPRSSVINYPSTMGNMSKEQIKLAA